jgi:hypothetical protein
MTFYFGFVVLSPERDGLRQPANPARALGQSYRGEPDCSPIRQSYPQASATIKH